IVKLPDRDSDLRRQAAKELGEMGPEAKEAVPALRKALRDSDAYVRRFSAEALGAIGPAAKEAVPDLALAMNDGKKVVALAAVESLGRIGQPAIAALTGAVKDAGKDPEVRRKAALGLGRIGPAARGAV